MKYLLIFLMFKSFSSFGQTDFYIPTNENMKFNIFRTASESSIGGIFSSKYTLKIEDENGYILTINNKKGIEFLINKLQEENYFWSANLVLYHISKKDAVEIWAFFGLTEFDENGFINWSDEALSYLEGEYKEDIVKGWIEWYESKFQ